MEEKQNFCSTVKNISTPTGTVEMTSGEEDGW